MINIVSVIIVNYKNSKMTIEAVNSIYEKTSCNFEVLIVDNSEDSNELETLKSSLEDKATIIDAGRNLGFGNANNLGARYSSGNILFFLNNDTLLVNDAISILCDELIKNECIGVVGPNIYNRYMLPHHSFFPFEKNIKNEKKYNSFMNFLKKKIDRKLPDFNYSQNSIKVNGYICGAALMVKKEIFESIGGFDKQIFMYAEESLLCELVKKQGFELWNIPNAKIIHYEGASFNSNIQRFKMMVDGNYIYYSKIYGSKIAFDYLKVMKNIYLKKKIITFYSKQRRLYYSNLVKAYDEKIKSIK